MGNRPRVLEDKSLFEGLEHGVQSSPEHPFQLFAIGCAASHSSARDFSFLVTFTLND